MTAVLLDQAEIREDSQLQHRGMNVAAEVVMMLSSSLSPEQLALIPHQRTASPAAAVRNLAEHRTGAGDCQFLLPDGHSGAPAALWPSGDPVATQHATYRQPDLTVPAAARRLLVMG